MVRNEKIKGVNSMLDIDLERSWFVTNSANCNEFDYVIRKACEQINRERTYDFDFSAIDEANICGDTITLRTWDGDDIVWE